MVFNRSDPSLVLVQPRKTRTFITERLLMGRKESNQTNKQKQNRFSEKDILYAFEIITCDPSIHTMDHSDIAVSNFMEKSIGLQRAKTVNP